VVNVLRDLPWLPCTGSAAFLRSPLEFMMGISTGVYVFSYFFTSARPVFGQLSQILSLSLLHWFMQEKPQIG